MEEEKFEEEVWLQAPQVPQIWQWKHRHNSYDKSIWQAFLASPQGVITYELHNEFEVIRELLYSLNTHPELQASKGYFSMVVKCVGARTISALTNGKYWKSIIVITNLYDYGGFDHLQFPDPFNRLINPENPSQSDYVNELN